MAKFVGMWEGNKDGYKQESESLLIDQLILLAREFKLDFHQYVPIIQQPILICGRAFKPGTVKFPEGKGSSPWSWWPQQWAPGNQTDGHNTRRHRGYVEWRPGASRAQAPQPATGTFLILCAAANNC